MRSTKQNKTNGGKTMKLIVQSEMCRARKCPALYQDTDGSFYVQGYIVDDPRGKLADLPTGETIVKVDPSLIALIQKAKIA